MIKRYDYKSCSIIIMVICLSPSIAFKEIIKLNPKLILYTSGTLPK